MTETAPETATYDDREARAILAAAAEEFSPDTSAANQAVGRLLDALVELGAKHPLKGLRIQRDNRTEVIIRTESYVSNRPAIGVVNDENGGITLIEYEHGNTVGNVRVQKIRFNPVVGAFEGTHGDSFIADTPGEPRRLRSALAVVLQQAVDLLRARVDAEKSKRADSR